MLFMLLPSFITFTLNNVKRSKQKQSYKSKNHQFIDNVTRIFT